MGKGGDVFRFVQEYEGVSFRHAFEILSDGKLDVVLKAQKASESIAQTEAAATGGF